MTPLVSLAKSRKRDPLAEELTEIELSKVTGGSQSSGAGAGKVTLSRNLDTGFVRRW